MFREMAAEEKEWVKVKQVEVDRKIAAGILPKDAEVAICLAVCCQHGAHGLEKKAQGGE
jgi:hypothetical protein